MNPLLISTAATIAADRMKPTTGRTKEDLLYEQIKDERKAKRWKYTAYTVGALTIGFIAYKGYKYAKELAEAAKERKDGGIKDAEKQVNNKLLSKDLIWYQNAGNQLFTIMDEYYYFTEPISKVMDVLQQLENKDDYYQLYADFGVKEETMNKYNILTQFKGNLTQWLQHEFSEENIRIIREKLQLINITL